MPNPNQRPKAWGAAQERVEAIHDDPRVDPLPSSAPLARVALKSASAPRASADAAVLAALPPESVVESLLNEVLADAPRTECDAHRRRIEELEATVRAREARIEQLEALLAEENVSDIVREELDRTRAHSTRLEACVDRLTKERDELKGIAEEVETLRSSLDHVAGESADLEESVRKERAEKAELAGEVARLKASLEALKRLA
jgi:DNA repair exonuclease SbcCD ATPase subunit